MIDTKNNAPLLNTVLDMLGVLVHGLVPAEGSIDNSRVYTTLVRKIRKDIGERRSEALDEVKRFLPLQKPSFDIYVVEPFDGVSNRMNPEMKKHGLQVARKVRRAPQRDRENIVSIRAGEDQQLGNDRGHEVGNVHLLLMVLREENGTEAIAI